MATLLCVMRDYIRPDEQFQWFKGNYLLSSGKSERFSVVYVAGLMQAQNGLDTLVPARISALMISDPDVSDAGLYTCRVTMVHQHLTCGTHCGKLENKPDLLMCSIHHTHIRFIDCTRIHHTHIAKRINSKLACTYIFH